MDQGPGQRGGDHLVPGYEETGHVTEQRVVGQGPPVHRTVSSAPRTSSAASGLGGGGDQSGEVRVEGHRWSRSTRRRTGGDGEQGRRAVMRRPSHASITR